ncbi:hypothetical protein GETHPA_15990 [Geothrix rubra]|uniref:Sel1 repeat family protein n=1 Tax=Geothrix rubra TaxID=2927977 RepID=A0ABQ5Q6J4_9BACT|nr:SEL1-like repeat protein [Geothrix rubra]GLH70066.1 hypothetical protein GETHPA_15990 [Geothrix rubra]
MTDPQTPPSPERAPSPDATQKLPTGMPLDPRSTVKMDVLPSDATDPGLAPPPEGPPLAPASEAHRSGPWKLLGGIAFLAVVLGGAYLVFFRGGPAPAPAAQAPSPEVVPAGVQTYLDQAKAGDAHAMRMLGVMYYYGLNVPQDREKGLHWYRQAAEKGSDAAREELAKLQAAGK